MPIDSAQIAAMNGGFQGMAMNQQAYSQMIGMGRGFGGNPPASMVADGHMGRAMNMAAGVGAPLAMGAMGLMGLDPMSIGMKAGMGAFGAAGGLSGGMGAIGAGLGAGALAAAPLAIGMAGAQYAGGQIWTGAQQQQQLNQSLRSSFNFAGPNRQGFSGAQMGAIGADMRHMTHQFGPGGEITGMEELTRLASNMGRMGMATGVRDAQDFSKKFKEMLTTVKTVAKEIGTSLEAAQEMMVSMRGSGIFKGGDQIRMAGAIKGYSAAGGLAASELSSIANIGSQISRSVGGLGRQGAFGGMRTLAQIGTAQQMGILNEEDIYNATGLTGAEGRQALAQSQMAGSAEFMRSGRGRRFLASIAGKDGNLNMSAVQEWMAGGVSTGRTMQLGQQNLSGIGRANFIRNEGRLRGAALEQLGGLIKPMAYQEWLSSRGFDPASMDDRSMLAFQRFSGLGREEAELAVKEVQRLPDIMRTMKQSGQDAAYFDKLSGIRKNQGLEGVKNRFAQAKEAVNGKLQQIGSEIFSEGSDMIEGFMNKLAGVYEQTYSKQADEAYRSALGGGKTGQAAFQKHFGGGAGNLKASGFGRGAGTSLEQFTRGGTLGKGQGALSMLGGLLSGDARSQMNAGSYFMSGESMRSQFDKAGYHFSSEELGSPEAFNRRMNQIQNIASVATEPPSSKYIALGADRPEWVRSALSSEGAGSVSGLGQDRLNSFGKALMKSGSPAAQKAWSNAKDDSERTRIMMGVVSGAMGEDAAAHEAAAMAPPDASALFGGKFATAGDRQKAFAEAFTGKKGEGGLLAQTLQGAKYGAGLGALAGGVGAIPGAVAGAAGGFLKGLLGGRSHAVQEAMGGLLAGEYGSDVFGGLMSGDAGTRAGMTKKVQGDVAALRAKKEREDLSPTDEAKLSIMQSGLAAQEYEALLKKGAVSEKDMAALASKYGLTKEQVEAAHHGGLAIMNEKARENYKQVAQKYGDAARESGRSMQAAGVVTLGEDGKLGLSKATADKLKGLKGGAEFASAMLKEQGLLSSAGSKAGAGLLEGAAKDIDASMEAHADANSRLSSMSVSDKRKVAEVFAGTPLGEAAAADASRHERASKMLARGGAGAAAAGMLGLSLSKDQMKSIKTGTAQERQQSALVLAKQLGLDKDNSVLGDIESALGDLSTAQKSGGKGPGVADAARRLEGILSSPQAEAARKEKKEKEAGEKDPLAAKQIEILGQINTKLGTLPQSIGEAVGTAVGNGSEGGNNTSGGGKK